MWQLFQNTFWRRVNNDHTSTVFFTFSTSCQNVAHCIYHTQFASFHQVSYKSFWLDLNLSTTQSKSQDSLSLQHLQTRKICQRDVACHDIFDINHTFDNWNKNHHMTSRDFQFNITEFYLNYSYHQWNNASILIEIFHDNRKKEIKKNVLICDIVHIFDAKCPLKQMTQTMSSTTYLSYAEFWRAVVHDDTFYHFFFVFFLFHRFKSDVFDVFHFIYCFSFNA